MQNLLNIQIDTSAGSYTTYTEKQSFVFTKLPGFYLVNARSLLPKVDAPRYPRRAKLGNEAIQFAKRFQRTSCTC